MSERITYASNGDRLFFLDGIQVDEGTYHFRTHKRDAAVFEDMIRAGIAPHGISDCTFMKGHDNGSQFQKNPKYGNYYKHIAEKNGGSVKGKRYLSGLARYPGDPEAWVSGRDDVKRIVEQRGWSCEGTVNVKGRESANPPEAGPAIAEDLLDKYADQIAVRDPNPHLVDRDDLKEQIKERMGPKKRKRPARSEIIEGVLPTK